MKPTPILTTLTTVKDRLSSPFTTSIKNLSFDSANTLRIEPYAHHAYLLAIRYHA